MTNQLTDRPTGRTDSPGHMKISLPITVRIFFYEKKILIRNHDAGVTVASDENKLKMPISREERGTVGVREGVRYRDDPTSNSLV